MRLARGVQYDWLGPSFIFYIFLGAASDQVEKICCKFQGRTVPVVVVKWLLAFTLECL